MTESKIPNKARYPSISGSHIWQPGILNRLPWLGILSLIGVLLCLAFNISVLVTSNGMPLSSWKIQPSVLLAISTAISTTLLRFALAEGAAITWWLKAIAGCTVNDLHRNWSFSSSLYDVFQEVRFSNLLGLASIASVVVAIDSPLFQRATTVAVQPVRDNVMLEINIAQQILYGYTGIVEGKADPSVGQMSPAFQNVVSSYNSRQPMYLNNTGCGAGNCSVSIKAAGLKADCTSQTIPQDFGSIYNSAVNGTSMGSDYTGPVNGMQDVERVMFSTNLTEFRVRAPSVLNFTATWKDQRPCKSWLQITKCMGFHLATLYYPIGIINGAVQFSSSLESLGTTEDTVAGVYNTTDVEMMGTGSALGGATGSQIDHAWILSTSGMLSQDHLTSANESVVCEDTFSDPTGEDISTLQEPMFRAALSVPNNGTKWRYDIHDNSTTIDRNQTISAVQLEATSVFQVHYGYLAAGAAVMVVCLVVVASTFSGWWRVGRKISMSPVEIAKAFNAPVLKGDGIDSHLNGLLPVVGNRRVRYGEVKYHHGKMLFPDENADDVQRRLELTHLHWASQPREGVQYV